jgi:hypothetical protein
MMQSNRSIHTAQWCAIASLILAVASLPQAAKADVVSDWNATTQTVLLATGGSPGVYFAMVHAAIYDAVNAIDGGHQVFAVRPKTNGEGASKEAAAAAAAYNVLLGLYPSQQALLHPAYAASLAAVPDGNAKTRGIAVGNEVAAAWLTTRAGDGREAVVPYIFQSGPGQYQRTPPAFRDPITPWTAKMKPFTMTRPSQFRAEGPPDLTSERYAEDLRATQWLGDINSTTRTAAQTEIGRFHTENPVTFWARNIRDFAATQHLDVAANARLFAMVFIAFGDASIACWDSKFYYNRWRPVTAIQQADTDGNPATDADAAWLPLAPTPPHPEYPAAHGCVSGAILHMLNVFFRTKHLNLTLTSTVPGSIPHMFTDTDEIIDEVMVARVYGGMHFPTSVAHGFKIGKKVGRWIAATNFRSTERDR